MGDAGFNTLDEFLNRPLEEFAPPSSTLPSAPKMSPGKELKLPASKLMSNSCSPNIFESPRDPGLFLKDTKEKQRSPSPVKNEVPSNVAALRARCVCKPEYESPPKSVHIHVHSCLVIRVQISNSCVFRRAEELDKELQWLCSEPTATKVRFVVVVLLLTQQCGKAGN